jgi:hypothetical protein
VIWLKGEAKYFLEGGWTGKSPDRLTLSRYFLLK